MLSNSEVVIAVDAGSEPRWVATVTKGEETSSVLRSQSSS